MKNSTINRFIVIGRAGISDNLVPKPVVVWPVCIQILNFIMTWKIIQYVLQKTKSKYVVKSICLVPDELNCQMGQKHSSEAQEPR